MKSFMSGNLGKEEAVITIMTGVASPNNSSHVLFEESERHGTVL